MKKYNMHIFFFAMVILMIASAYIFDSCRQKTMLETLKCPCRIIRKEDKTRGKVVIMRNTDSVVVSIISDELYQKEIGYIYK